MEENRKQKEDVGDNGGKNEAVSYKWIKPDLQFNSTFVANYDPWTRGGPCERQQKLNFNIFFACEGTVGNSLGLERGVIAGGPARASVRPEGCFFRGGNLNQNVIKTSDMWEEETEEVIFWAQ